MKPDINPQEAQLLIISAAELCYMLEEREDISHVRQTAYEYLSRKSSGEIFHVQVTVTRREDDFLEAFQTEEMTDYSKQ